MAPQSHTLFATRLDTLRQKLLTMLATVDQVVRQCVSAYTQRDEAKAWAIAAHDFTINKMETEIDELSLRLLACEHPVAHDLRFVIACMRISNDVERMADEAANIAERTLPLVAVPPLPFTREFTLFGDNVIGMVSLACRCVAEMNVELACELARLDETVDLGLYELTTGLVEYMKEHPAEIDQLLSFLIIARRLERIADLATNIGESVFFAVQGVDAKHHDLSMALLD